MKIPTPKSQKIMGLVLSGALLATQSLFAYQPEKNFWSERRRAVQRSPSMVLASLPQTVRGPDALAAQFPSPEILRSSLTPSVVLSVPKTFLKGHADLLAALSPAHGSVRKVSLGKNAGSREPVVIHIQDVHMNAEAQRNIQETVTGLLKSGQLGLVALEGSTEDIALQPFVDFPNRKAVELTADYLLRENKISGPIHAAMTAQGKLPRILGIDDPAHYQANVLAYKESAPKLEEARLKVKKQQGELDKQKKVVFSPALLALDHTVIGYRNDKVSLGEYVEVLAKNSKGFKVMGTFLKALKTERTLDFKQVEAERSRLIEKLTQTLTPQEISALMAQSLAYRTGELRYGDFYAQLKETCRQNGIHLSEYPAMDEYIRYVLLADSIDAEQLLNEIAAMEKAAYDTLAKTPEEKLLATQSRHVWLTSKLVDFSLTPPEWGEYKGLPATKGPDLISFESFYREAESRDTAMAKNLLSALDLQSKSGSTTPPIALLVTGGFHAEGMAKQLTEKGATVISYVPKIEKVDTAQGSAYLSVFTQEKTPLEKLFQGEKLFLSPDMARAAKEIGAPVVPGINYALNNQEIDVPIEKRGALRKFLDETMGPGVDVQVRKTGEDPEKGTVKISVKIGTKEMILEIKTGDHFEIVSVNDFIPKSPSWFIGDYGEVVARLHTWLGPVAKWVVTFTEAPILWALPGWTAAHYAWWLVNHPKITSVSHVVWQLAFLEGTSSQMKRVSPVSRIPFFATIQSLLAQLRTHPGFNLVSPIQATIKGSSANHLRDSLIADLREAYGQIKSGERRRFSDISGLLLGEGRISELFPTPNGKTGKRVSFGGGYDVKSVVLEVGRDTMGLYWAFESKKKDGGLVMSTLRWDEETQAMVRRGVQLELELRSAYEELKLGERRRIGDIEELVYLKSGQFCVNFPTPNGKTGKAVNFGGGRDLESVELEVGRDTMGLYWAFQSSKKAGGLVKSTLRWDERTRAMVSEGEQDAEQLVRELRSAYEGLKLAEQRRISDIEEFVILKEGRLRAIFPTPNGKTGKGVSFGGGYDVESVELEVGRDTMGLYWAFQSTKKDGGLVRSTLRWDEETQAMVTRGEQLERELRSAYEELKLGERRRIGNIEELVYLKLGQLCVHFPTPNGKTGKVVSFGGGYNVESVELEVGRDTMGLYWTFQSTKKGGGLVKSTQRWDEGTQAMVSEAEKEAEQLERELRSAYEELKLGERRRIGNIEELVFLKLGRLYVVFPTPNGKTGKVVFMGGGRNLKSVHLQVGREENGVIFWEFQSQKEDGSFVRSMMKWVNGKMQLVPRGGEKGAMDDVVEVLDSVVDKLDVINPEMSFYLAVRHGRDFRTILWGAIPNEIKSMLNREKLEALMTQKVLETIKKKVTGPAETALRAVPAEPDISPRLLEDVELTQSEIQHLAHEMENVVTTAEAALKDSLQTQAVDFVKRLEEDHFFSQYYSPVPGKALLSEIVRNIDTLLADPALIPISRSALEMLRGEVVEAKGLQDQLHEKGLKKERFLNLYQILGIQKILAMKKVLLGDEMGLGKTLQTLCAFLMSEKNEMVVVAPRKALGRWLEDIHKHLSAPLDVVILAKGKPPAQLSAMENVTVRRIVNPEERMAYLTNARAPPAVGRKRIIVTNFELLPPLGRYLRTNEITEIPGFSTGFVAIDEVHLVKNKNKTSSALLGRPGVEGNALLGDYRVAISGTPLENAPIDLLAILRWLSLGGESEAEQFFAALSPAQFKKAFQKADLEKLSRLSAYLAQHMIRRLKGHVMRDLPEKRYVSVALSPFFSEMRLNDGVPVPLPGNYNRQISMYDRVLSNYPAFERVYRGVSLEEDSDDAAIPGSAQIMRLEQVTMTPDIFRDQADPDPIDSIKIDALVALTQKHLAKGEFVSVMSDHLLAIRAAKAALLKAGVPEVQIAMFNGEMNSVEQERNRERFQRGDARIILCTRQSAGTSIELTRADAMIFMNTPWTPAAMDQAVDRIHRQDSEGRHRAGKEIVIYNLVIDFPISIDALKINLIRLKRAFGEMLVNGNLTPEILDVFENTDGGPIATIRESMRSREAPLSYERKLFNEFHLLLGRAIQSRDPELKHQLWEEISEIYHLILFHKATFFANQANLDHLSGDGFPELKGRLVKVLDLGSGPSVLYHAYDQSREKLKGRSLQLQISEFDASAAMLARGVVRPGEQTVGSFSRLGEAYPANTFDVVNMSYSFDLADHPAGLIKTIHSLLKEKGLFALILPKDTIIPEDFYKGMEAAGFKLRTAQGGQLESKIPETHYHELVREYGEEFAKDIARTAHTRHTYLLAEKTGNGVDLSDNLFRLGFPREHMDIEKIKKLRSTEARFEVVPPDLPIEGIVDYDPTKRRDEEALSRWILGNKIHSRVISLTQWADKLSRQSPDSTERPKIVAKLRRKLLILKSEIETADISIAQRLAIGRLLQRGTQNKFLDQWTKHEGKEYAELMAMLLQGSNGTNGETPLGSRGRGEKIGGKATGWIGYGVAAAIGAILGLGNFLMGRLKTDQTIGGYTKSFAVRHAARFEDLTNAAIALIVGLVAGQQLDVLAWLSLGTLSPPLGIVLTVGLVIGIWFLLFMGSHAIFSTALERVLSEKPSDAKASRLFLHYLVPLLLTPLVNYSLGSLGLFPFLSILISLITSSLIPFLTFNFVRSAHDRINVEVERSNLIPKRLATSPDRRKFLAVLSGLFLSILAGGPALADSFAESIRNTLKINYSKIRPFREKNGSDGKTVMVLLQWLQFMHRQRSDMKTDHFENIISNMRDVDPVLAVRLHILSARALPKNDNFFSETTFIPQLMYLNGRLLEHGFYLTFQNVSSITPKTPVRFNLYVVEQVRHADLSGRLRVSVYLSPVIEGMSFTETIAGHSTFNNGLAMVFKSSAASEIYNVLSLLVNNPLSEKEKNTPLGKAFEDLRAVVRADLARHFSPNELVALEDFVRWMNSRDKSFEELSRLAADNLGLFIDTLFHMPGSPGLLKLLKDVSDQVGRPDLYATVESVYSQMDRGMGELSPLYSKLIDLYGINVETHELAHDLDEGRVGGEPLAYLNELAEGPLVSPLVCTAFTLFRSLTDKQNATDPMATLNEKALAGLKVSLSALGELPGFPSDVQSEKDFILFLSALRKLLELPYGDALRHRAGGREMKSRYGKVFVQVSDLEKFPLVRDNPAHEPLSGLSDIANRLAEKRNETRHPSQKATSQWGLRFAEWLGSKVSGDKGRNLFGEFYKRFAALIEWSVSAKVAFGAFLVTLAFSAAPLSWAIALAVGTVYGILFFGSHFIPKSMAPVTKVNVGVVQALTMGVIYGVLIGATPFLLGAVPLLGVPGFGMQVAGVLWGLAGFLHFSFDKENLRKEGEQAARELVTEISGVTGAFEAVMPGVQKEHTEQIVGKGSPSPDFMTETLSRLKTDKEFRAGFLGVVQMAIAEEKLSGTSLNLLSAMVMAATGQPMAYVHVLGNSPVQELQILERLIERPEGKTSSGFSVALVVSQSQRTDYKTVIDVFVARGVSVFSVNLHAQGWTQEALVRLDSEMSPFLAKANGIVATVGEKVGINLTAVAALSPDSKLRTALMNALTLGEVVEIYLQLLRLLASNA